MPNQLKRDPTRTTMLRRKFMADMTRRFKRLSKAIQVLVVDDDAFGLEGPAVLQVRQAWRFRTDAQKVKSYRQWLQQQVNAGILSPVDGISGKPWTATYIESAYKKGGLRAYTGLRAEELANHPSLFKGGQAEFMRTAFGQPEALHKIELLYERAFSELKGVTDVMGQQMSRTLSNGLAQGYGPYKIARELRKNVSNINNTRAKVIARTETIRAHAEGQLDAYEHLGVEEVGVMAEWSTAGDEMVCIECGELEGVVMTVKEARGLLPRHPNCRCCWIPANKARREKGQVWTAPGRKAAVRESIQAEFPKLPFAKAKARSVWAGKKFSMVGGKLPKKTAAQKWAEEFTRKARGPIPGKKVPISVGGKAEKAYSEKLFGRMEHYQDVFKKKSKEIMYIKNQMDKAYKACGIKPGASAGYCDQVSVQLWDVMGRPKNMKPYSVWFGEEEHVLLYAKKTGLLVDATGNQFGNKVLTLKSKSGYRRFHMLTKKEVQDARELVNIGLDII